MASIVGWYGPLIDLSKADLYVGDFVQLLVCVHDSSPIHYKSRKEAVTIHVGDDTRPHFPVSIWPNQIGSSMPVSGDVVLLQNVKITKYGDVLEGKTLHCSSLLPLIHPYQLLVSKGLDELVAECRVGIAAKEKLRKVIEWVKQSGSTFCNTRLQCHPVTRNWKLPEERKSKDFIYLSEVLRLTDSCKAVFHASVGEIFLPFTSKNIDERDKENMFLSRRLYKTGDSSLATDLICTGCQICGSPLNLEHRSMFDQDEAPLYCSESSNRLHVVSFIYRPFMLYVWDESEHIPLLVRNKAAEILFGNIKAEQVYSSFRGQQNNSNADPKYPTQLRANRVSGNSSSCSLAGEGKSLDLERKQSLANDINFYAVWLILLKALLRQGKNSPLKFEVNVDTSLDRENGMFQMVSVWMSCFRTKVSSNQNV